MMNLLLKLHLYCQLAINLRSMIAIKFRRSIKSNKIKSTRQCRVRTTFSQWNAKSWLIISKRLSIEKMRKRLNHWLINSICKRWNWLWVSWIYRRQPNFRGWLENQRNSDRNKFLEIRVKILGATIIAFFLIRSRIHARKAQLMSNALRKNNESKTWKSTNRFYPNVKKRWTMTLTIGNRV